MGLIRKIGFAPSPAFKVKKNVDERNNHPPTAPTAVDPVPTSAPNLGGSTFDSFPGPEALSWLTQTAPLS
ncbi:hypothetical protein CI238_10591 [Colletotrichum incanum]|uniref:Uncharacterized protein n=1 Tax=Colletotrichum incanum TaxID=1573173 RepID=A0A167ALR1_COLIC|nr:hypothetical protein CI238_10591 [Colletotrichum incanum]